MKLGFNVRCLEYGLSGIERYTKELIEYALKCDEVCQFSLFSQRDLVVDNINSKRISYVSSSKNKATAVSKFYWEAFEVGKLVKKEGVDVFHSPSFILPCNNLGNVKSVVTIHDLAFLKLPACFDFKTKLYFKLLLSHSIKKADRVICISESTKRDVLEYFPNSEEKLRVVYNGFERFPNFDFDTSILSKLNVGEGEYFLTVGTINERKNLLRTIKAFKLSQLKRQSIKKLVIVGNSNKLPSIISNDPDVIISGFVDDNDLANLYYNCFAFIFASLYEGFGFPILEAMSFGKPIICSNNSSIPEITEYPTEFLVNPYDVKSIANMIESVTYNQQLYDDMSNHGKANIKRFSWSKMGKETQKIYMD
jgi:glycosyltransferase involved in cell wall biosynthesis